jgi:Rieske Fe-S protein
MTTEGLSRRHALAGAATVGLGLPLLAACGDAGDDTATDPSAGSSATSESTEGGGGNGGNSGDALASTSDIEVGGGTIFASENVVVTQPTEGEFKGFSAICTHQGCTVGTVSDGMINCPCHGSMFSIEDGSVQAGPATGPLSEVELSVKGDQISLA